MINVLLIIDNIILNKKEEFCYFTNQFLESKLPKDFVFIFGHSGIQEYPLVAQYMKRFPSCLAEISVQSKDSIKYLIEEVGSERILFGSDWPALPQAITLSRVFGSKGICPPDTYELLHTLCCILRGNSTINQKVFEI